MQSEALVAAGRRGEELRYVTEHFRDLQGLYFAPFWAWLLLLVLVRASTQLSGRHLLLEISLTALFPLAGIPCANAWYKRYGVVQAHTPEPKPLSILDTNPPRRRSVLGFLIVLVGISIVFTATLLSRRLDEYRAVLNLWIALVFTVPRCFYSAPAILTIQLRRGLYIVGSAIIFFVVLCIPLMGPLHSSRWFLLEIICTTLLALSLYDHWLLNHLLRACPEASYD